MAEPLVVFLPGIMGSRLRLRLQQGAKMLWSEDASDIVFNLINNSALYQYTQGTPVTVEGVLEGVNFKGYTLDNFYGLLLTRLRDLRTQGRFALEEFAYDWREDIYDTARKLGEMLAARHAFVMDDEGYQEEEEERRLTIVAHSMGGLVTAVALTKGYIHPRNVKRIICIGTPFLGAPAAFRGLYSTGYLPGITWLQTIVSPRKDRRACRDALLRAMQSFLSVHQLLPPAGQPFVQISGNGHINPLSGAMVSNTAKATAQRAHLLISQLERTLIDNQVEYRLIFGVAPRKGVLQSLRGWAFPSSNLDTDFQFKASIGATGLGGPTYFIKGILPTEGDGTVPVHSATLNDPYDTTKRFGVVGVKHSNMCNNKDVVDDVEQWLP